MRDLLKAIVMFIIESIKAIVMFFVDHKFVLGVLITVIVAIWLYLGCENVVTHVNNCTSDYIESLFN